MPATDELSKQVHRPSGDAAGLLPELIGDGRPLLALVALGLILSGIFALFLSFTGQFLPHDISFLGMHRVSCATCTSAGSFTLSFTTGSPSAARCWPSAPSICG
jgi:hypothetical protein